MSDLPRIDSSEVAQTSPNAMANGQGDVFYPDDEKEALWFAIEHKARPVSPGRFPFHTVAAAIDRLWPALEALDVDGTAQYYLEREER